MVTRSAPRRDSRALTYKQKPVGPAAPNIWEMRLASHRFLSLRKTVDVLAWNRWDVRWEYAPARSLYYCLN